MFSTWRDRDETQPYTAEEFTSAFDRVRQFFPRAPYDGTTRQRAGLRALFTELIRTYIGSVRLRAPKGRQTRIQIGDVEDIEIRLLKQLTWQYVIRNPALAAQQFGQRRILADLFRIIRDAADSNRDMLPPGHRELLEQSEKGLSAQQRSAARTRIVADIIAGMTEKQAIEMHRRLTGADVGTVLYPILS